MNGPPSPGFPSDAVLPDVVEYMMQEFSKSPHLMFSAAGRVTALVLPPPPERLLRQQSKIKRLAGNG